MDFIDLIAKLFLAVIGIYIFFGDAAEAIVLLFPFIYTIFVLFKTFKNNDYGEFEKIQQKKEEAWRKEHPLSYQDIIER